jgi:hypothetical protein
MNTDLSDALSVDFTGTEEEFNNLLSTVYNWRD